jgi:4'-phosphopantetheinyl transferase
MTSHYFGKIQRVYNFSDLPEASPVKGEAVIVIAETDHIKALDLPEEELVRAAMITHQPSRDRYLAGRHLLRRVLARWLDMSPRDIPIALSGTGKPFLPQHPYHISISHTAEVVAALFSLQPAGIDLEQERALDAQALAHRFFSPGEVEFLEQREYLPGDFFRLWCAREAAIKADGRGLGQLLAATKVMPVGDPDSDSLLVEIEGVKWSVHPWIMRDAMHGAVAFPEMPRVIHWCDLRESLG